MSLTVSRAEWKAIAKASALSEKQRSKVSTSHTALVRRIGIAQSMLFAIPKGLWSMQIFTRDDIDEALQFVSDCECEDPELLDRKYWEHVAACSCSPTYLPTIMIKSPTKGKVKSGHRAKLTARMTERCFGSCKNGGVCTTRVVRMMDQKVVLCECA